MIVTNRPPIHDSHVWSRAGFGAWAGVRADFYRPVHCLLGLPVDAVDKETAVGLIRKAAISNAPCLVSTPNLNFIAACRHDNDFRNSLIGSELVVADGAPLVLVARLLGIPIHERVAGADLFDGLRLAPGRILSVYFFGGPDGAARDACMQVNAMPSGIRCVGYDFPGYQSVEEMSDDETIARINRSGADFLIVSLGAIKGHEWIVRNRARINVPVLSHLGAVVNFAAGHFRRAPLLLRHMGFEWLWRIKEEPWLWRRYLPDALFFLRLMLTRVIPNAIRLRLTAPAAGDLQQAGVVLAAHGGVLNIKLNGAWRNDNLLPVRQAFEQAVQMPVEVELDLGAVTYVDSAFIGLVLLLLGQQRKQGLGFNIIAVSPTVRRSFRYACAGYLLDSYPPANVEFLDEYRFRRRA